MSEIAPSGERQRRYVAGDWYAVIGPRVTVVLPPQERERVPGLWALVEDGAGFEDVLDALISGGLRDLSGFVLLSTEDDTTLVVVRGSARAVFEADGERIEVAGSSSNTWAERTIRSVSSVVVELQEVPEGARSYVIEQGLVRLGRLSEGAEPHAEPYAGPYAVPPAPDAEPPTDDASSRGAGGPGLLDGAPPALVVASGGVPSDQPGSDREPDADPETDSSSGAGAGSSAVSGEPAVSGAEDLLPAPGASALSDEGAVEGADEGAVGTEPVRAEESLVSFGSDPGPADEELTEVMALQRSVDPEGTEPFEPLQPGDAASADPDDLMQDFAPDAPDVVRGDDPLGLDDLGHDALGLAVGPWSAASAAQLSPPPGAPTGSPADSPADDPADHPADGGSDHDGQDAASDPEPQDHDGATRHSPWDEAGLSLVRPGIPGQEPAPAVTARPVARLMVSDGRRIDVDRVVVLGRAPSSRRFPEDGEPLLVRVESPHQEISATHVEIRPGSGADHGTAVVTDLGSTNGTVVAQPGLEPDELQPGVSVQLIPGAIIDLGDGVTLQVIRP